MSSNPLFSGWTSWRLVIGCVLAVVGLAGPLAGGSAQAQALQLVADGQARAVIVVPEEAWRAEAYAAEELQHHIAKASGQRLPIVAESEVEAEAPDAGRVYLGRCQASLEAGLDPSGLPTNGFTIRLIDGNLHIVGRDDDGDPLRTYQARTGTLFGVYEFLEKHLGVRWLWPGDLGEYVPEQTNIEVAEWDQTWEPYLKWSDWRNRFRENRNAWWPNPEAGEAFFRAQEEWKRRLRFADTEDIRPSHNFSQYWERYGDSHPEYFNLLPNGERAPLPGDDGKYITMCVAEPALHDRIIETWQGRNMPSMIKIGENDSPGMCTCDKCRDWDAPDWRFYTSPYWGEGQMMQRGDRFTGVNIGLAGPSATWGGWFVHEDAPSLSDRYARFYKRVHELASEHDPDVLVGGFAYANYWRAPKETELNEDIIISYVPPLWFPYTQRMSREFREEWDGWQSTGATVLFRPNLTHAGHAMPIAYGREFADDYRYIAERGTVGADLDSLLGAWATQGPTLYAVGRVIQRPELSTDEIFDEFYDAFGPASSAVRAYFDHWEAVAAELDEDRINLFYFEEGGGGFKDWAIIADRIFTEPVLSEGWALLSRAKEAAAGDETTRQRVEFLEKGLRHAEYTVNALKAYKRYQEDSGERRRAVYHRAVERLFNYRDRIQDDMVADFGHCVRQEPYAWYRHYSSQ